MRAPFPMLPVALALAASGVASAQENARVLFCTGDCAIVDAKGVRRPAPKGTVIPPGFRLVTGPGTYVQVKLSPDSAIALGERANVLLQRDHIVLSDGRIRVVGGEAFGKPLVRPIELRTREGTFTLRNADVEMKTSLSRATPTLVKVNVGDALFGSTLLSRDAVQSVSTDGLVTKTSFTPELSTTRVATLDRTTTTTTTLTFQPTSFPTRLDTFSSSLDTISKLNTLTKLDTTISKTSLSKQLTSSDQFLSRTAVDLNTGDQKLVIDVFKQRTDLLLNGALTKDQIKQPIIQDTKDVQLQQIDLGGTKYQLTQPLLCKRC